MLHKAMTLALEAYGGQVDRGGHPYILHPFYLSHKFSNTTIKIISILHDVVEDTYVTLDVLDKMGFDKDVIQAIDNLTKRKGELYESYMDRVSRNATSLLVKIEDMIHNSDPTRIDNPTEKHKTMIEKCETWLPILRTRLSENFPYSTEDDAFV